ncbi:MAG: extracellular matrix regulator RemB [Bacillota bacterium]|jgi:hypothetical protein
MYLHLGADISVIADDIIGIFDYDLIHLPYFKELLELAEWNNSVVRMEGKTKSVVLTQDQLYLVPLSRATLARRWEKFTKPFLRNLNSKH